MTIINKIKKIKPVIRLIGSKYRLFNQLYIHFNLSNITKFYDVFGGTGIVGINIKNINPNIDVYINDYDNILPLTKKFVEDNNKRFNGFGGYSQAAIQQYNKKVLNGLWTKLKIYNNVLKNINISHLDYKELLNSHSFNNNDLIYLDPPYFSNFKAYKHKINLDDFFKFILFFNSKNNCKIAISFKYNEKILNLFKNWNIYYLNHTNTNISTIKKDKNANEILITNFKE
ncbi:Site-specific DNA methylase [Mycoplasmopsis maculosa]|uniref:site-specific DNA-methyltransferase (adenine-specific) n=1 Tax=Mycoplasmopsis maculosa TaxID=114885 RepID=A0A449B3Z0_9BACT|nr:DNA adenine methylase [Mycoplasmopsis maculosa]VEU75300.1 Site-specific DNA methylase [Mycoplasmopsis maculosa]